LVCVSGRPEVEGRDAAVEVLDVVRAAERLGVPEAGHLLRSRPAHQRDDGGLDFRRAIEASVERSPSARVEHEPGPVGADHLGALATALNQELRDGFADHGCCLTEAQIVCR